MYTLFIIGKTVTQHTGLKKKLAQKLTRIALERNEMVQVLAPNKKMFTICLKDFFKNEI